MNVIPFPRRPDPAEQHERHRLDGLVDRLAGRALGEPGEADPQLAEAQAERDRCAARGQWNRAERIDRQLDLARHADDRAHVLAGLRLAAAVGDREDAEQARAHLEALDDELARDERNDPEPTRTAAVTPRWARSATTRGKTRGRSPGWDAWWMTGTPAGRNARR